MLLSGPLLAAYWAIATRWPEWVLTIAVICIFSAPPILVLRIKSSDLLSKLIGVAICLMCSAVGFLLGCAFYEPIGAITGVLLGAWSGLAIATAARHAA